MFVPHRLKTIRLYRGLTQKQLAEKCGMHDSAIRRYENGRQNPKRETIERIAKALDVTWYLFDNSLYSDGEFNQYDISAIIEKEKAHTQAFIKLMNEKFAELEKEKGSPLSDDDYITIEIPNMTDEESLLNGYRSLNKYGKDEAISYIANLTTQEKYTAPDSSTASDHEEGEP